MCDVEACVMGRLLPTYLVFLLVLLPTVTASAQHIGDGDINRMRFQHEHNSGYKKSAKSKKLPTRFLELEYKKPELKDWLLPYESWEQNYRSYFKKHYGDTRLTFKPTMIVMHYTVIPTAEGTYRALSRNEVSVQLMIGHDGTVYRLMPLDRRCTGAYGVNHVALSIEMVAQTESDLLSRTKQVYSSFCLVRHLMAAYDIPLSKVVAHYEVSEGKKRVAEYTDLHDKIYPDRYPPSSSRLDPGPTYMSWLRQYLKKRPPTAADA
jgi:N-acetylmuramoyl-L-alanine amidase